MTLAEAAKAFAEYVATDDMLRAGQDGSYWPSQLVRDGQSELTAVEYRFNADHPPRRAWGTPKFLVPRLRVGDPLWFSAAVVRDGRTAIATFAKGTDWRLSSLSLLEKDARLPKIELDADGYATSVPPDDKKIMISPKFMAPLHATVAERGSNGIAVGLIAPGPYTTEIAKRIALDRAHWKGTGYSSYDSILSAGDYPVYALRATDGSALIQYSLTRTTTVTTKSDKDVLPVPAEARWFFDNATVPRMYRIVELRQYATVVPPAGATGPAAPSPGAADAPNGPAAQVIAQEGAITRASDGS